MPAYAFLQRSSLRTDDLSDHLAALKRVGVPYTDEMIANAAADAIAQAEPDSAQAPGVAQRYGKQTSVRAFDGDGAFVSEMDALVAYLQILGRLTDVAHTQQVTGGIK